MKKEKEKNNIPYMMKLLWKADKKIVIFSFYKQIAEQAFSVIFYIYLTQYIFTCIEQQSPFNDLLRLIIILCAAQIAVHIVSAVWNYQLKRRQPLIYKKIYEQVIEKSLTIEYKRFEQPEFYDNFTRALSESVDRGIQMMMALVYFAANVIAAVFASLVVVNTDPFLLVFVIPSVIISFIFGKILGEMYYKLDFDSTRDNRMGAYVKRVFYEKKYAGELRLFGIKSILLNRHKEAYDDLYDINRKYRKKIARLNRLRWTLYCLLSLGVPLAYIAFVVKTNPEAAAAPYIAMAMAIDFISGNISDAIDRGIEANKHSLYVKNLRSFLEYTPEKVEYTTPVPEKLGDIDIENMSFRYEGESKNTLNSLNIHIKKGERVAFVGHNGAGKTTLVKLIMGLYNVTEGEIKISGSNIASYDPDEFHKHFGTVFQDFQVFALPLSQNVLMKEPENEAERQLVEEALIKAQFGDKLEQLRKTHKGIDTPLTKEFDKEGVILSGGQTQKIAIARVFAKNPDIVILDEPSSALDPVAEFNMYENMMKLAEDKTVIFISHRLSSARTADRIYMLENGSVIEEGTHDSLMKLGGKYAAMFNLQSQNYQEN